MKQKNSLRFLALLAIIVFIVGFSAFLHSKKAVISGSDETETRRTDHENKTQGDLMMWETISRHLLSSNQ